MALLRVDARPLVPRLRAELVALLTGLTGDDWDAADRLSRLDRP